MQYYKDDENKLHWLESTEFEYYLPRGCVPITDEEADAIHATEQAAVAAAITYAQKRANEYPPMTDYLDGVVKGDQAQIDKYIADCQAVKAKYPKG
jgi:hypothetical protein